MYTLIHVRNAQPDAHFASHTFSSGLTPQEKNPLEAATRDIELFSAKRRGKNPSHSYKTNLCISLI